MSDVLDLRPHEVDSVHLTASIGLYPPKAVFEERSDHDGVVAFAN